MSMVNVELAAKHIGLMHELLPRAARFALLINPSNPSVAEIVSNDAQAAGRAIGRQIDVIAARTAREIDEAFASLTRQGALGFSWLLTRSLSIAASNSLRSRPGTCFRRLVPTRTVPIVFVGVTDPVGAGLVDSLARPGGNATGFMQFEYGLTAKWPEVLKEIAPGVTRVAVLRNPAITGGIGQFAIIQYVASLVGVEVSPVDLRDAGVIERAVTALGRAGNGGLIVTADSMAVAHRELIIRLAARHKLPAVISETFSSPTAA